MNDYAEGKVTEIGQEDGSTFYNVIIPAIISRPGDTKAITMEFLIDTGSDKSMISYSLGCELGLEPPGTTDDAHNVKSADGRGIPYIVRKVDMQIGSIVKKNILICWCLAPRVYLNFLGMDFLHDYKFILNGRTKKFYITKHDVCVSCRSYNRSHKGL